MLASKKLADFTNLFSPHDFYKNENVILSYFKDNGNRQNKLVRSNKIPIR